MDISVLFICLVLFSLLLSARAYSIRPRPYLSKSAQRPKRTGPCSIAVFLGSGGHTSEALQMLSALPPERYSPRIYIISEGDIFSKQKALSLSTSTPTSQSRSVSQSPTHTFLTLPRARRVHQPLYTTPPTAAYSYLIALYHLSLLPALRGKPFADVLLLNGPGTCVALVGAVWASRFCGFPTPQVIYVESFARVKSLSLSAKLVRPFVDRFIVQWPEALGSGTGECHGWLV